MRVEVISTPELGDRSYIVHDGTAAVVVDPQRDLDRVERVLDGLGLTCALVAETHVHNDYVTGGLALARRTGAAYAVAADEEVAFTRHGVRHGDAIAVGDMTVRVIGTPGHTDFHVAYVIGDAVFTGGSLLYGGVGRTDLVDPSRAGELARAQYRSVRRLAAELPDDVAVYPTHGFGSFCSAGTTAVIDASSIGAEAARNDALTEADEDEFVRRQLAGLTAYPHYYAHMARLNRRGPTAADLSAAAPVDPAALRDRIAACEWVADLRSAAAFAADHLAGTVSFPLDARLATYLGWVVPWGAPVTLVGSSAGQVAEAQRHLARIGIDRPAAAVVGTPADLADTGERRCYPRVSFAEVAGSGEVAEGRGVVLDVRRDDERAEWSVPGSVHIPLHALLDRLDELPDARLWVHCASGYRAGIAASLLDRAGRDVVHIDGEYGEWTPPRSIA
ncbi:MAG: MBL fold metallo-hydrolase [Actinomycetota bacterium]|nr:MBL fold metallo-hydrolase [Actinomycetota bacterium]